MSFFSHIFFRHVPEEEHGPLFSSLFSPAVSEQENETKQSLPPRPSSDYNQLDLTDPDQLCQYVSGLQTRLTRSEGLCEQANKQFEIYRKKISDLQTKNVKLETELKNVSKNYAHPEQLRKEKKERAKPAKDKPDQEVLKCLTQNREALSYEEQTVRGLLTLRSLENSNADDTMSLSDRSLDENAMLPSQPFVVVLVDGDSYRFSGALKHLGPAQSGVVVAQRLHVEVSKLILTNHTIPPSSKIVARVFFNSRAHMGRKMPEGEMHAPARVMMNAFQETRSLFDCIDCGTGKERVDAKIQENAHLYIANQSCHAIFLAICNDNGYARMLEKYQYNPLAQSKIFLVDAGAIVTEIAKLQGFTRVTLPQVFQDMYWLKPAGRRPGLPNPLSQTSPPASSPQEQIMPTPPTQLAGDVQTAASKPSEMPCTHGAKCKRKKCQYRNPASRTTQLRSVVPNAKRRKEAPAATYNTSVYSNEASNDNSQATALLKSTVGEMQGGQKSQLPTATDKDKSKRSREGSMYLGFIGVQDSLRTRALHGPCLVPFNFRWTSDSTAAKPNDRKKHFGRVMETEVD